MSYTPTTFVEGAPPGISATELNKFGSGIAAAAATADAAKAATDAATSSPTASTLAKRDVNGRLQVATPSASNDAANKVYVDNLQTDYVRQPGYAATTGSANTYAVTLSPAPASLVDGLAVAVKINAQNTGACTLNVNGLGAKAIKKGNGNDIYAGNLKAGSIYTLRYNSTTSAFILQGEGGGGDALPGDVLSGKIFANDVGTDQVGAMPNRGAVTITPGTVNQQIQDGYHNGGGVVVGDPDLVSANILTGKDIFGVAGSATRFASGSVTTSGGASTLTITGLGFTPVSVVVVARKLVYPDFYSFSALYGVSGIALETMWSGADNNYNSSPSNQSFYDYISTSGATNPITLSGNNIVLSNIPAQVNSGGTINWYAWG